ncbi:hypothetical protein WA158_004873 [Blastocystis sp. Blastoise]
MSTFNLEQVIANLTEEEKVGYKTVCDCHQEDVLKSLKSEEAVHTFITECQNVSKTYPGGLKAYVDKYYTLIDNTMKGVNPLKGYRPELPVGKNLEFGTPEFIEMEKIGLEELQYTCFVIVAGGLGERLGYPSIKISLPSETTTNTNFINLLIENIKHITEKYGKNIPLAIMTSNQTYEPTVELLESHNYYGMKKENVSIMKQDNVPAIKDKEGHVAVTDDGHIVTKPHGHGDVHLLLNQWNLPQKWVDNGMKWVVFCQDTNGPGFHCFPSLVGVSQALDLDYNSMTVLRKPGEKVGAISHLVNPETGDNFTCNIEYNQLNSVLKDSGMGGDIAGPNGYSNYPGNINLLCIRLSTYVDILKASQGIVPEFINPKFDKVNPSLFTSPTRLECMMQDFPRLLAGSNHNNVGFVSLPRWYCFSAVKNDITKAEIQAAGTGYPESAYSGEEDMYRMYRHIIRSAGVKIDMDESRDQELVGFDGLPQMPITVIHPSCGVTAAQLQSHFGKNVEISKKSCVVFDAPDVYVENFKFDGYVVIKGVKGAKITLKDGEIKNAGAIFRTIKEEEKSSLPLGVVIRNYVLESKECREIICNEPGDYVFSN